MAKRRDTRARQRSAPSCWPCRRRKLKCDRGLPACSNCVHREDVTGCRYASTASTRHRQPPSPSPTIDAASTEYPDDAQQKLANLERIVLELFNNQQVRNTSADDQCNDRGAASVFQHWARHSVDEARWDSVLHEIQEVRAYLSTQRGRYEQYNTPTSPLLPSSSEPGPTLLFGSSRNVSRAEILSSLPSKHSCDSMVERFFAHLYPPLYILHETSFRYQYERFWEDPDSATTVWIAIVFAILRIAALDYLREDDEPAQWKGKCQSLAIAYRQRVADCLTLADYLQPHEFLIEALILHQYAEYVSCKDVKSSVWVLTGTIIRLAMRMGYHQLSQPTLSQSPFKMEIRRRAWAYLRQSDIMLSFQMGLPSMVDLGTEDVDLPRNIHDDENFHEGCAVLPPAVPSSEPTRIGFLIAKSKLVFAFARALAEVNSKPRIDWERLLEIDRELRLTYEGVPEYFKLGQLQKQDSLILCSARFSLATIYHKSLCVSHSRFLGLEAEDNRYSYSTRVCLSSALSILRMQATQDQVLPVDGRLRSLTNYQTSLAIHDYLLAAAILSTHLFSTLQHEQHPTQRRFTATSPSLGLPSRIEMIRALEGSAKIFDRTRDQSSDAWKAADVLGVISRKFLRTIEISKARPKQPDRPDRRRNRTAGFNPNLDSSPQPPSPSPRQSLRTTVASGSDLPWEARHISSSTRQGVPPSGRPYWQPSDWSSNANKDLWGMESSFTSRTPVLPLGLDVDYSSILPEFNHTGSNIGAAWTHHASESTKTTQHQTAFAPATDIDVTDNSLPAWFSNESLPSLAVNEPLSTLWNLNNMGQDLSILGEYVDL